MIDPTIFVIVGIAGLLMYFLPWIIASARHHKQLTAIFWANFFLGFTGLGWVGCFIWAMIK